MSRFFSSVAILLLFLASCKNQSANKETIAVTDDIVKWKCDTIPLWNLRGDKVGDTIICGYKKGSVWVSQ